MGWLIVVGAIVLSAAVLAVIAVFVLGDHRGPRLVTPTVASPTVPMAIAAGQPCLPVGSAQTPTVSERVAGLLINRVAAGPGFGLDRCDRTAVAGPWTVVVRRPDGSLGRHGAVVTFPVGPPTAGRSVGVDGVTGKAANGMVTWPVAGAYAQCREDRRCCWSSRPGVEDFDGVVNGGGSRLGGVFLRGVRAL